MVNVNPALSGNLRLSGAVAPPGKSPSNIDRGLTGLSKLYLQVKRAHVSRCLEAIAAPPINTLASGLRVPAAASPHNLAEVHGVVGFEVARFNCDWYSNEIACWAPVPRGSTSLERAI
jgi:hypothetical protein